MRQYWSTGLSEHPVKVKRVNSSSLYQKIPGEKQGEGMKGAQGQGAEGRA